MWRERESERERERERLRKAFLFIGIESSVLFVGLLYISFIVDG